MAAPTDGCLNHGRLALHSGELRAPLSTAPQDRYSGVERLQVTALALPIAL